MREVAHFCTLGLTLPSEFCRFPVKIMAAYEALKKKKKKNPLAPRASGKSIVVARQPQKGMRVSGHIANVKAWKGKVVQQF